MKRIFNPNYYTYLFNFIGKWLSSYFLKKNEITHLNFSDCNLKEDGFLTVLSMIYNNQDITFINLRNNSLKYADIFRLRTISPRLKKLEYLNLNGNDFPENAVEDVFQIIVNCTSLNHLEMDSMGITASFEKLFKLNHRNNKFKLEEVSFANNFFNLEISSQMLNFLDNCSNLKTINLTNNRLTNGFFFQLNAFYSKKKRHLMNLILEKNLFDDTNCDFFSEFLSNATELNYLNLNGNKFTEKTARIIIDSIKSHKNLCKLTMNSNKINNNLIANQINIMLKTNKVIKYLDFRTSLIGEEKKGKDSVKIMLDKTEEG